jgi:alkylation response protein AidB-like acyl-CoA dehydrogenase
MIVTRDNQPQNITEWAAELAAAIAPRAADYDCENKFGLESIRYLQEQGYAALTVPVEFGGTGAGLTDLCHAQEQLAMGDAAVALAFGMSLIKIGQQAAQRTFPEHLYEKVMRAAVERGALINSVATEPNLGSPSRGGKPETVAIPAPEGGWHITGHKTWCSLAPVLDFIIVYATIKDGTDEVGRFLVEPGDGLEVVETWDSMAMRATGSHDMLFKNVYVPEDHILGRGGKGGKGEGGGSGMVPAPDPYFSLPVIAVYLGVAADAQRAALDYAAHRVPLALGKPLTTVDRIRESLAQNEADLRAARRLLYTVAREVEKANGELSDDLKLDIYVAKQVVANNAIAVVDRATRIAGGASLATGSVLERAYRNVRAGLNHPPADDVTARVLAKWVIEGQGEGRFMHQYGP